MATTRFYLDMRGRARDGKGSILIIIRNNDTTASIPTGIRISPDEWNGTSVVRSERAAEYNALILKKKSLIDQHIALLSLQGSIDILSAAEIKKGLESEQRGVSVTHTIPALFHEYMEGGDMKEGTKIIYRCALNRIIAFAGESAVITDIDLKWLRAFDKFLSARQGANGRSIYMRSLRAVYNYAKKQKYIIDYPFEDFHIKSAPTRKRCISWNVLRELYLCPTSPTNEMYKDYFFLMLFLIGINSKDLLLAKKSQVINGRLEYIRSKTGKKYSIKIEPEAQEIIGRHSGCGEYLLDAMDHCKYYQSFAHQMNDALKTIGRKKTQMRYTGDLFSAPEEETIVEPFLPEISTQWARHTWATLASEINIPIDTVSLALGHTMGNRTTLIYIKPSQSKVDEANRKMIDYFKKRLLDP